MRLLNSIMIVGVLAAMVGVASNTVLMAQQEQPAKRRSRPTEQPPPPPPSQQTPTPQVAPPQVVDKEDDVVRVDTELVTLTATVADQRGRNLADLKQSDFTVYEDGVKQQLSYFNTGDRVPVSLGIVFDTSGSMVDKIEGVVDAVEHFVKSVAPGDEILLIRFSDDVEIVQGFTDDRRRILRAVEGLEPRGSTALYDAISLGLQRIATQGKHRKRALLLVTDGNDTASEINLKTTLELARKSEVIIYALGIGHGERGSFGHPNSSGHDILGSILGGRASRDEVDMKVLNSFADATGGRAFFLENAHEGGRDHVDEAAEEVAAELKQQYSLGYVPSNKRRDGSFRQIKVELADKSLRARTKRGYYAKREGGGAGGAGGVGGTGSGE